MTASEPRSTDETAVTLRSLLSVSDTPGIDMESVRATQLEAVNTQTSARSFTLVVAWMAMALELAPVTPHWLIGAWFSIALLTLILRVRARNYKLADSRRVPASALRGEWVGGALSAVIMAAPIVGLASQGQAGPAANVWIIMAAAMALYGYTSAPLPILFCSMMPLTGIIATGSMLWLGNPELAAAAGLFTFTATLAVVIASGHLVRMEFIRRKADDRAETVSLLLREFEDTGADWLWQIDATRRIDRVSPRFAHAVGMEPAQLERKSFLELIAGDKWEVGRFPAALHDLANRLNRREAFSNLLVPVQIADRRRWWELSASPRFDADGSFIGFRGVGSDVTEQRDSAEKIAHLARFDGLTGLPNRLFINETLAGALEQATAWRRRCAFMMIDLDRFKAVNDTLGHPIGDRLLAQVAGRLKALCSDQVIAGRLGGDEFAVVLREISGTDVIEQLGRRIIEAISRPYDIDHHTLYVGASIGYAIGPRDGASVETLTRNADLALYRSKERGGSAYHGYEPTLHDQASERREIEIELRAALQKNEFEVVYQPVVHADGSVDGFEALLRWKNAKLGSVSPVKFIPVAEDTRLIGPIGEWVMMTACREAARWPSHTKVAVNVSAEQLSDPNFINCVVRALSHSGLPASRLELEVTESVFLREVSGALATLEQVRGLGVKLSLDDFGTGYSSLGYLRMGQFATIKIDRSFVQGALAGARESIAIIRAVVAMADSLEMSTTAEGVETAEEAAAIVKLGCKKLQGYHFGRPMPAHDALAIFGTQQGTIRSVA